MNFFGNFGLWNTFQEQIALKSLEVDQDNLRMKFSTLSVVFTCLNFGHLHLSYFLQRGIKLKYPFQNLGFWLLERHKLHKTSDAV